MPESPTRTASGVREGDVIAGKYRVQRVLGAGGMGVVVAAEHLQLRQRVAIKFLLPSAVSGADTVARFVREAQAAARIQSEHVARVLDVATLDDGLPYMVMELLEGQDLGQLLGSRGSLPVEEAVGYMLQACEGVAEAHAAGIIHRDIKPSNLFVCERGGGRTAVKVLDFGISKSQNLTAAAGGDLGLTKTSAIMGSPLYMSPEQMVSAKHVDTRTDIWSLGVALFELVAGKTPFNGDSMTELIAAVLQQPPLRILDVRPDLPPAFVEAVMRSLEKERDRRYANVAELAAAIAPFGPRHSAVSLERISGVLGLGAKGIERAASSVAPTLQAPAGFAAVARQTPPVQSSSVPGTTAQPVSSDRIGGAPRPLRSGRVVGAGIAIVAFIGIGGALVTKMRAKTVPAATAESPSIAPSPQPMPSAMATAKVEVPATSAATVPLVPEPLATVPTASTASTANHHPVAPHPAASPQPAPAARSTASAASPVEATAPTCHVVRYFDADGETRFKKECP